MLRIPTPTARLDAMPREPRAFPDAIHLAFARRVRALRLERELSQAELAERMTLLGVPMDRTAIARIEQAAIESEAKLKPRKVSISEAAGFAEAFVVPLAAVLPYDVSAYDYSEPLTRAHFDTRMNVLMAEVAPEIAPKTPDTIIHAARKREAARAQEGSEKRRTRFSGKDTRLDKTKLSKPTRVAKFGSKQAKR
jgi:transcriptional regulator with XRE-family HTH domain